MPGGQAAERQADRAGAAERRGGRRGDRHVARRRSLPSTQVNRVKVDGFAVAKPSTRRCRCPRPGSTQVDLLRGGAAAARPDRASSRGRRTGRGRSPERRWRRTARSGRRSCPPGRSRCSRPADRCSTAPSKVVAGTRPRATAVNGAGVAEGHVVAARDLAPARRGPPGCMTTGMRTCASRRSRSGSRRCRRSGPRSSGVMVTWSSLRWPGSSVSVAGLTVTLNAGQAGDRDGVGRLGTDVGDRALDGLRAEPARRRAMDGTLKLLGSSTGMPAGWCRRRPGAGCRTGSRASRSTPESKTRPGSAAAVRLHVAGALPEDDQRVGVRPVEHVVGRRHQRRLDHHRRPVRVHVLEQGRQAGHVRARHRGAAVEIEVCAAVVRRRHRRQDVLARGDEIGLEQVAARPAAGRATRSWP